MTRIGFALILVAAAVACGERAEGPAPMPMQTETTAATDETVAVGKAMPAYSAELLDGSEFSIAKERGNVLLLNLWATWCGPCRYEIPELEKLHQQHAAQRFKVIGVSVDEGGDQIVREFVDQQNMTYPVALDPEGRLAVLLDTTILPTSILVDREGRVIWKHLGVVTADDPEMKSALQKALSG